MLTEERAKETGAKLKWVILGIAMAVGGYVVWRYPVLDHLLELVAWLSGQGTVGMLLFGTAYFVAGMIMLPMFPIGVLAGMAYGISLGLLILMPGAVLGATLGGWLGSTILRERVLGFVETRPAWRAVCDALSDKGFRAVLLNRLAPVLPFGVQNYLLGAVGVRPMAHCLGTLIGMLPALLVALYLGSLVTSLAEARAQMSEGALTGPRMYLLLAGAVAVTTLAVWLGRVARRALNTADT